MTDGQSYAQSKGLRPFGDALSPGLTPQAANPQARCQKRGGGSRGWRGGRGETQLALPRGPDFDPARAHVFPANCIFTLSNSSQERFSYSSGGDKAVSGGDEGELRERS